MRVSDYLFPVVLGLAMVAMLISRRLGDKVQSVFTIVIGLLATIGAAAGLIDDPSGPWGWVLLAIGVGSFAMGSVFLWKERRESG